MSREPWEAHQHRLEVGRQWGGLFCNFITLLASSTLTLGTEVQVQEVTTALSLWLCHCWECHCPLQVDDDIFGNWCHIVIQTLKEIRWRVKFCAAGRMNDLSSIFCQQDLMTAPQKRGDCCKQSLGYEQELSNSQKDKQSSYEGCEKE